MGRNRALLDPTLTQGKRFAKGNYAAYGSPYRLEVQATYSGMLVAPKTANFSNVTDGLSNTAMASEVRTMASFSDQRGAWALPWNGASLLAYDMHPAGGSGYNGDPSTINLTAQKPNNIRIPNADVLYKCNPVESQSRKMPCFDSSVGYLSSAPRSGHPNLVNVVYGDAHVNPWSDNIDAMTMGYIISINDGHSLSIE
jgi:hypothetical protein